MDEPTQQPPPTVDECLAQIAQLRAEKDALFERNQQLEAHLYSLNILSKNSSSIPLRPSDHVGVVHTSEAIHSSSIDVDDVFVDEEFLPREAEHPSSSQESFNSFPEKITEDDDRSTSSPESSFLGNVTSPPSSVRSASGARQVMSCKPSQYQVRVRAGVLHQMPTKLRVQGQSPAALLEVAVAGTDEIAWSFVKNYDQLKRFADHVQFIVSRAGGARAKFYLTEFPPREYFDSLIPCKIDVRNDMINAFFTTVSWICNIISTRKQVLDVQNSIEHALSELCLSDMVSPSPSINRAGYDNEMSGFLLSRHHRKWICRYYATNAAYLDVVETLADRSTKTRILSICLYRAKIEKELIIFDGSDRDARYLFNIYEMLPDGKRKVHSLTAESEALREQWLLHLRYRVHSLSNDYFASSKPQHGHRPLPLPYSIRDSSTRSAGTQLTEQLLKGRRRDESSKQGVIHNGKTRRALSHTVDNDPPSRQLSTSSRLRSQHQVAKSIGDAGTPEPKISLPVKGSIRRSAGSYPTDLDIKNTSIVTTALEGASPPEPMLRLSSSEGPLAHRRFASSDSLTKPERSVFGVMPKDCKYLTLDLPGLRVPSVVARCIQLLQTPQALSEVGLFRISGTQTLLDELESTFNAKGDFDLVAGRVDAHTGADLLKRYLRSLPQGLLGTWDVPRATRRLALTGQESIYEMKREIGSLNSYDRDVLNCILKLLNQVSQHQDQGAMSAYNLGMAMAPSLRIPQPLLEVYIEHQDEVF